MKINLKELVAFGILGGLMFISKLVMEFLPNIHLLAVLTVVFTLVFRQKALYPIYVYVALQGLVAGGASWWIPYLYIWTLLWGATMLIPRRINRMVKGIIGIALCSLHGFLFGVLCAPTYAVVYSMSWETMLGWIVVGIPFDVTHGIGNLLAGLLILPLERALNIAKKVLY